MSLGVALMKSHFTSTWKSDRQREKSESQVRGGRERTPAQKWSPALPFDGAAEDSCHIPEEPVPVCLNSPALELG